MDSKLKIRLSLSNKEGEAFMGIGLIWLLKNIKECASISKAAQMMNMSYMKAVKILNRLEKNLGQKILIRNRGGNMRGGSELTEFGERFVKLYDEFQLSAKKKCILEYEKFLKKLELEK